MQANMVGDYPSCGNPISTQYNLCGRTMCARHIQWIDMQGWYGAYTSAHYRCDFCSYQNAMLNQQTRRLWERMLITAGIIVAASAVLLIVAFPFQQQAQAAWEKATATYPPNLSVSSSWPIADVLMGVGFLGLLVAGFLVILALAVATTQRN